MGLYPPHPRFSSETHEHPSQHIRNVLAQIVFVPPLRHAGQVDPREGVGSIRKSTCRRNKSREKNWTSNIFSLGAVLYEMVMGQHTFQGKSQLSIASAILEKEPTPINSLNPLAPPALDHAIKKCLAKLPDERWQSASDLAGELKWIAEPGSQAYTPLVVRPGIRLGLGGHSPPYWH